MRGEFRLPSFFFFLRQLYDPTGAVRSGLCLAQLFFEHANSAAHVSFQEQKRRQNTYRALSTGDQNTLRGRLLNNGRAGTSSCSLV